MVRNNHQLFFAGIVAAFMMVAVALVVPPQTASAGGVVGGGGTPGGCASCPGVPHTNNGYGWYNFGVYDDGPADISGGGSWDGIRQQCIASGNDRLMAFIIERPTGGPGNSRIYAYESGSYGTYNNYRGDDGGNWMTYATAKAFYDTLPGSIKGGFTWGSNVAWFCYDTATEWYLRGDSYIQKGAANIGAATKSTITAKPGERLNWYHDMRNNGPEDMDKQIWYNIQKTGFSNGWNDNYNPQGWAPSVGSGHLLFTHYATHGSSYTLYDVTQADVGSTLCQGINWQPASWNNGGVASSNRACAVVPYNYQLTPEITNITDGAMAESAIGAIPVQGRVVNSGDTRSHSNINWQITQVKFAPGVTPTNKAGGTSAGNPCAYYTGELSCGITSGGSGVNASGYGHLASVPHTGTGNLGDEPVGTHLCFSLSIQRHSSSSTDWRHSALQCFVVGKEPKVQVLGGDLIVGRKSATNDGRISNVDTSISQQLAGYYYGSWAEYAIVTNGLVTNMASGSAYVGGSTSSLLCSLSLLTLTNGGTTSCSESNVGRYTHTTTSPNIAARFPISSSTPRLMAASANLADDPGSTGPMRGLYTTAQETLSLNTSSVISPGQWVVLNVPDTTVTITGDITYTDADLHSAAEIPQVVIIAKNIIVASNVRTIDAWLVATGSGVDGRINTCGAGAGINESTRPHAGQCTELLKMNGPLSANHLILRRTAGAGTGSSAGDPAEVINLRADAYIWASSYSPGTGRLPSVKTTELPPRF